MAFLVFLIGLVVSLPLLWLHPTNTTKILGIAWMVLTLIVWAIQRVTKLNSDYLLSYEEEKFASRYAFFFRVPGISTGISNGSTLWQPFTLVWGTYLGFAGLWQYLPVPIVVFFLCIYLRVNCRPIFFAQEECRRDSGKPDFQESQMKLFRLRAIFQKLHGANDPP